MHQIDVTIETADEIGAKVDQGWHDQPSLSGVDAQGNQYTPISTEDDKQAVEIAKQAVAVIAGRLNLPANVTIRWHSEDPRLDHDQAYIDVSVRGRQS